MSDFIANTPEQTQAMLKAIGVASIDELFSDITPAQRPASFDIPEGMSEMETHRMLRELAQLNRHDLTCFLGGGYYDHFIPSVVDHLAGRSEFYTAYTPYQPECSQGTLQAIFEYQSAVCRLTDMDIANASLYDGGTALYEAMMMAHRATSRKKIVVDGGVHPFYRQILRGYTRELNLTILETPLSNGHANREELFKHLNDQTACVILQNPNFFGTVDDYSDIMEKTHRYGALGILSFYPVSLGLLKTPGEMNADIATAEGQSLGLPLSFGGPYLGILATRKELARKMPGRIVGETTDMDNRRAFVLTLQAREQHIRREKATSNICSNEALCALRAVIYLSSLGKQGLRETALLNHARAEFTKQTLRTIRGVKVDSSIPTFNEFIVTLPQPAQKIWPLLLTKGFTGGLPLSLFVPDMPNAMLIAVTEKRTKDDIIRFAKALESALWS